MCCRCIVVGRLVQDELAQPAQAGEAAFRKVPQFCEFQALQRSAVPPKTCRKPQRTAPLLQTSAGVLKPTAMRNKGQDVVLGHEGAFQLQVLELGAAARHGREYRRAYGLWAIPEIDTT